ncbi:uncharacterized protein [Aristolochia californica]|uniref:uncharacterized protein isoform X1 n=1 Tax=Aristolochia californica TaxID=171875 RepID=UPI0035DC03B4
MEPPILHPMTTISTHSFGDASDSDDAFSIRIIENIEEEYGMFVWPCSVVLAEYVWQQRLRFAGANVLELGAGTSLPGLVAAKVGSNVILSDSSARPEVLSIETWNSSKIRIHSNHDLLFSWNPQVLTNIRRVCLLNRLECKIMGLTWGEWDEPFFSLEPNILLGADVLYDTKDFADLFATMAFLLKKTPGSVFITTYHNRSGHHLIEYLMVKWGLKCAKLVDAFSFMPSYKASGLQGNIQLVEIMSYQ